MKKYEFTEETIEVSGHVLHRIKALIDIPRYDVKAGNLGGFIEREENLSHEGDCWVSIGAKVFGIARVYDNAEVSGDAKVSGNAEVRGNAHVCGYAHVAENAKVFGNAQVFGIARVYDNAEVSGDAKVSGNAEVRGNAKVFEHACIYENAKVFGSAYVYGYAHVAENAKVFLNAHVYGDALVYGSIRLVKDAEITKISDVLVVGPIGSRNDYTTFYKSENGIMVSCGCFNGTIEEFEKAVEEKHGNNKYAQVYISMCNVARLQLKEDGV